MDPINALAGTWVWFAALAILGAVFFAWRRGRIRPQPAGWDAGDQAPSHAGHDHAGHAVRPSSGTDKAGATDSDREARPRAEPEATHGGRRRHGCC